MVADLGICISSFNRSSAVALVVEKMKLVHKDTSGVANIQPIRHRNTCAEVIPRSSSNRFKAFREFPQQLLDMGGYYDLPQLDILQRRF